MNTEPSETIPGNIMVVDDTPANLTLLVGMLKSKGYVVRPAPSGKIALQAAEREPPDLIMLDINMPEMDGFEVCRRLKASEKTSQIPVIFISALSETLDKVKAFSVGGVDYVTKPFQFEEVEARVETHLKLHRYQAQIETWNLQLASKVREQTLDLRKKNDGLQALVEKIKNNYQETILAFSNLLELRKTGPANHASNVSEIVEKVALAMDLPNAPMIRVAGLLHDIGKIGMPEALLLVDPAKMRLAEFEEYRKHAVRGQAILEAIDDLRDATWMVRHHHERYDGGGFPDMLGGNTIPLGSRIIAIADALDWYIQNPATKEAPIDSGLERLKKEMGRKFDPALFEVFENPIRDYYSRLIPHLTDIVSEVLPRELLPGMVLSGDVRSGTGVLILKKGSHLTDQNIQFIERMYAFDPPKIGVYISQRNASEA